MKKAREETEPVKAEVEGNWQFSTEGSSGNNDVVLGSIDPVRWTAPEFLDHEKSSSWYMTLALIAIVTATIVYLLSGHDTVATGVVIIVAAAFGFSASRKPRDLEFTIDGAGVHIADKLYAFSGFKSFSIVQQDDNQSIWLMPLQRFMPIITIYFHPDDEEVIASTLASVLPLENRTPDGVDRLMHKVRF